jgi:peptidoglycan hydrolase-like protein with peptidoglycan-binding domain
VAPTPSPTPGATSRPTAKPTKDPDPTALPKTYTELKYGDKGDAVNELQLALIRLGYLDGEADGIFGKNTRQAVYDFNLANGLISGNLDVASNKTQQLLYDGNPVSFQEPAMALYFEDSAYAEWYDLSGDEIQIHFQVTNKAKHKTVKAFELYAYATDVWGNRVYGSTTVYYWTTTKNVKPGATVYSDYVTLPDGSEINLIYCGISRIIYADGSVEALEDDEIDYFSWSITD